MMLNVVQVFHVKLIVHTKYSLRRVVGFCSRHSISAGVRGCDCTYNVCMRCIIRTYIRTCYYTLRSVTIASFTKLANRVFVFLTNSILYM